MRCQNCGCTMEPGSSLCHGCGAAVGDPNPAYPMNWYRILTRLALPMGAGLMFLLGVVVMLGLPYQAQGFDSFTIYSSFPVLLAADFIFALVCWGLGAMCLVTRARLLRFRTNAPMLLYLSYGLSILMPVVFTAVTNLLVAPAGTPLLGLTELCELAGMVAGIALNAVYFTKRRHMFIY